MGNDRSELHKKVEARRKELQKVLADSERAGHPALRIEALRTELSVVENATTGGWDTMAEVTAVELTNWLVATQNLIDGKGIPAAITQRDKPAQQLDTTGGAAGGKSPAPVQHNKPAANAGTGNSGPDISGQVALNDTASGNSGNSASELGVSPPVHGKDSPNQKV